MTAVATTRSTSTTVGSVLATVHEGWMKQVATFLSPALSEHADFWSRWAGVRFLGDQFRDRFRLECALVDALAPLMPDEAVGTLQAARAAVERAAEELMAAGRRRATRLLTARLARHFIDQLALWCVEVELATSRIWTTGLPRPATRLLRRLRLADALWQ
jgi:hypothetical protein